MISFIHFKDRVKVKKDTFKIGLRLLSDGKDCFASMKIGLSFTLKSNR